LAAQVGILSAVKKRLTHSPMNFFAFGRLYKGR
jgi:hypothetical protein